MNTGNKPRSPGRPPKFMEDRRPVTVTLPMRVLSILGKVDPDRARAIAKLADEAGKSMGGRSHVEIVKVAAHRGLIVVADSALLRGIEGLRLIEISPTRFLITLESGLSIESLEVQIHDMIEDEKGGPEEIALLKELLRQLRQQRRSRTVSKEELLIVGI